MIESEPGFLLRTNEVAVPIPDGCPGDHQALAQAALKRARDLGAGSTIEWCLQYTPIGEKHYVAVHVDAAGEPIHVNVEPY